MVAELTLTLPRDPRHVGVTRRVTRSMLEELGVADAVVEEVELAVAEACSNAVRHAAGSASYRITVEADEHGCAIHVVDSGPGFTLSQERLRPSTGEEGHGLHLIDTLVDEASFERRAEGMAVRLWKSWSGPGPDGESASEHAEHRGRQASHS